MNQNELVTHELRNQYQPSRALLALGNLREHWDVRRLCEEGPGGEKRVCSTSGVVESQLTDPQH